jgi:hypothetical protein
LIIHALHLKDENRRGLAELHVILAGAFVQTCHDFDSGVETTWCVKGNRMIRLDSERLQAVREAFTWRAFLTDLLSVTT